MTPEPNDLWFAILLIPMLAVGGYALISLTATHAATRPHQQKLFLIAFGIRVLGALAIYEMGLGSIVGDEDSSGYYMGRMFAGIWEAQGKTFLDLPALWAPAFEEHHRGYYYLVGTLYFLTGAIGRMSPAILNCFFGAMTVVFAYRIARSLFSNWSAVRVGWLVCLFPSMIIWSCQTLKEPVVILLETVALYACLRLKQAGFDLKYILFCGASIMLLYPFRFYASLVAAVAVFLSMALPEIGRRTASVKMAGFLVALLVLPIAYSSGVIARSESQLEQFDLQRIQQFRTDIARGSGSGVENTYDLQTPGGFTVGTLVGAAHLLLAPFPWQIRGSLRAIFTLPELLLWWWLVWAGLIPGIKHVLRHRLIEAMPALVFISGLGLLYSMMFGNVGLIFRQRAQLLPWLLVFAVAGLELREIRRTLRQRRPVPPIRGAYLR